MPAFWAQLKELSNMKEETGGFFKNRLNRWEDDFLFPLCKSFYRHCQRINAEGVLCGKTQNFLRFHFTRSSGLEGTSRSWEDDRKHPPTQTRWISYFRVWSGAPRRACGLGCELFTLTCLKQGAGAAVVPVSFRYLSQLKCPAGRTSGEETISFNLQMKTAGSVISSQLDGSKTAH